MSSIKALAWLALALVGFMSGCATAPETESSTPWNVPQSWEKTVPLPGSP